MKSLKFRMLLLLAFGIASVALTNAQTADDFNPLAGFLLECIALQPDGKILAGKWSSTNSGLARFGPGGSPDPSFNVISEFASGTGSQTCLAMEPNGNIVLTGSFDTINGQKHNSVVRLDGNGSPYASFSAGSDSEIYSMAVQTDGRLIVGGSFTSLCGQPRNKLGRLNTDGSLDTGFNPGIVGDLVFSLALQEDGRILVGGWFASVGAQARHDIARLNVDGSVDTTFNPGANAAVFSWAVQPDGKVLLGGDFTNVCGQARSHIARLNEDGSLDIAFNPGTSGGWYGTVYALVLQTDGNILVGGDFGNLGGQPRRNIGRLNPDGSIDTTFDPGASQRVSHLAVQTDGKVLVGGNFTNLAGQARNNFGRLNNTTPAIEDLSFNGTNITWFRGGSSPEVLRTTFEVSTNAGEWTSLGAGRRVEGGWRITGVSAPARANIRARGFVTVGKMNSSNWFVERIIGVLSIISQPQSITNNAGTAATFSVEGAGDLPLSYQWLKNGVGLQDGENVVGSQSCTLTLRNLLRKDAAAYSVILTNASGSVTSSVATLGILDPAINLGPAPQKAEAGGAVVFSSLAAGSGTLSYQWRKDSLNLTGATNSVLTLTNVQSSDAGNYDVVVSNGFGAVTSAVAVLTVNGAIPDAFNPASWDYNFYGVNGWAVQIDGRILIGANCLSRLSNVSIPIRSYTPDGNSANGFQSYVTGDGYYGPSVNCFGIQPDGKIIVGGYFVALSGQARHHIGRVFADGTPDLGFNPGANNSVSCLAVQLDGKILVGGSFTTLAGAARSCIGRLNGDGTLDTTFNLDVLGGESPNVYSVVVQADGKILVGGSFTNLAGQPRASIGRLNADGSLDTSFDPRADHSVKCLAVQADGKILVGGFFRSLGGELRLGVGRLNQDGSLDPTFNPTADTGVNSIAVQADGKILLGGSFVSLGGQPRNSLGRLNSDGSLDGTFDPAAAGGLGASLILQADGKILVAGQFDHLAGQLRYSIGRLNNTYPSTETLSCDGSRIFWSRGGASPEIWSTTFEGSSDGLHWFPLGTGTRLPNGWELRSSSALSGVIIRARGFVSGGMNNGSCWIVESTSHVLAGTAPVIIMNGRSVSFNTNRFGFQVAGSLGSTIVVDGSTDLVSWTALVTNTIGSAPLDFTDTGSANLQWRFYRARVQ